MEGGLSTFLSNPVPKSGQSPSAFVTSAARKFWIIKGLEGRGLLEDHSDGFAAWRQALFIGAALVAEAQSQRLALLLAARLQGEVH